MNQKIRIFTRWAPWVLNFLIVLFLIGKRYYYSYGPGAGMMPKNGKHSDWNDLRTNVYAALPIGPDDNVFVGNSLTEGFPVTEIFGPHAKNRGIGGNTTFQVLKRIEPIALQKPQKIFLEAGINDLNLGNSVDSTFKNYTAILNRIKALSPSTQIIVQSLFPTCGEHINLMPQVIQLNSRIAAYCDAHHIYFVNIFPAMLHNYALDTALTNDGIHLNAKGYDIWEKSIDLIVKANLN